MSCGCRHRAVALPPPAVRRVDAGRRGADDKQ